MRHKPKADPNRAHKRIRAQARAMALRHCIKFLGIEDCDPPARLPDCDEAAKAFLGGIREARGLLERRAREYGREAKRNGKRRAGK